MPKAIIFSDGPEGLVQLQTLINELEAGNAARKACQNQPDSHFLPDEDLLIDDEDLRLIVQLRISDYVSQADDKYEAWADTDIDPEELDEYRDLFPEQEYRLVAVYDEIVTEFDSVDQQDYISATDEIGQLKAEVLNLKAQIANLTPEQDDKA